MVNRFNDLLYKKKYVFTIFHVNISEISYLQCKCIRYIFWNIYKTKSTTLLAKLLYNELVSVYM